MKGRLVAGAFVVAIQDLHAGLRTHPIRAPAAATEYEAAAITHLSIAAVVRRQSGQQIGPQGAMDLVAGFVEGAGPLRSVPRAPSSRVTARLGAPQRRLDV